MRSRMRSLGRATGSNSNSQHTPHEGETTNFNEVDKEDDKGYRSCDDNDDDPILNEDDDYIL